MVGLTSGSQSHWSVLGRRGLSLVVHPAQIHVMHPLGRELSESKESWERESEHRDRQVGAPTLVQCHRGSSSLPRYP